MPEIKTSKSLTQEQEEMIDALFTYDTSKIDLAFSFTPQFENEISEDQVQQLIHRTMKLKDKEDLTKKKSPKKNKKVSFQPFVLTPFIKVACIVCIFLLLTSTSVLAASILAPSFVKTYIPGGNVIINTLYGSSEQKEDSNQAPPSYQVLEQPLTLTQDGYTVLLLQVIYHDKSLDVTYKTTYSDGKQLFDFENNLSYYVLKVKQVDGSFVDYEDVSFDLREAEIEHHLIFQVNQLEECEFILQEIKQVEEQIDTVNSGTYTNVKEEVISPELFRYSLSNLPLNNAKQIKTLSSQENAVTSNEITLLAESSYQNGVQHIGISFESSNLDETIESYGYVSDQYTQSVDFVDDLGNSHSFLNEANAFGERNYFELQTSTPLSGILSIPFLTIEKQLNTTFEFEVPAPGVKLALNLPINSSELSMMVTEIECGTELVDGQYSLILHIDFPEDTDTKRLKVIESYLNCLLESNQGRFYSGGALLLNSTRMECKMLVPSHTKKASITLLNILCRIEGNWELPIHMNQK